MGRQAAQTALSDRSFQYRLADIDEAIIVDLFAGGGGMSISIENALGRSPDIAINHSDDALSMHQQNHPQCEHFVSDVWEVCPLTVTRDRPVGLLHLSPDCTDFSQSKGGQPRRKKIRALSWVGYRWAGQVRPAIITLENVAAIQKWGPLIAKRCKSTGRVIKLDGTVALPGERVPVERQFLVPDPKRAGQTWRQFIRALEALGYQVETRVLNAADYGAATKRKRLFMVARCDGRPIVWPQPTHFEKPIGRAKRWLRAADVIDWSLPCPSIFERKKPLVVKSLRRIANGIVRYVLNAEEPFLVPAAGRPELNAPHLIKFRGSCNGVDIHDPVPTITSGAGAARPAGAPHALGVAAAYLAQVNGGKCSNPGHRATAPLSTITTIGSQQQLVTAMLAEVAGLRPGVGPSLEFHDRATSGLTPDQIEGAHRCAAFIMQFYTEGGQLGDLHEPLGTVTTKDRFALITVTIRDVPYALVDIGIRMLTPRELYAAQGFPASYVIDRGHDGRRFPRSRQVHLVGNSVSPPPAEMLVAANAGHLAVRRTPALKRLYVA